MTVLQSVVYPYEHQSSIQKGCSPNSFQECTYLLLFKKVILYSQDETSRRRVKKSCFVLNAAIIQLLATGPLGIMTWSPLLFSLPRHLFRWLNHLLSFSTYLDYIFLRVRPGTVARILCLLKPYKFFTIMISATMPFSEWKSASEIYHN